MATLYSHTFESYTGVVALPATHYLTGLSPEGGATYAVITTVTVMFYKPTFQGTYNMKCMMKLSNGEWSDYSYEDVIWAGETTQIITFTFDSISASISSTQFEVHIAKHSGPGYTTYTAHDAEDTYFVVVGEWAGMPSVPSAPINPTPADDASGITLDDTIISWEDGGGADTYDVYFRPYGEFFEKIAADITELSTSTLVAHTVAFNGHYSYGQLYLWCVIAKNEYGSNYSPPVDFGIGYGGTIWEFNAMVFDPPLPTGVTLDEDGDPTGTPTGESNMITVKRLVAAANDRIWYEQI